MLKLYAFQTTSKSPENVFHGAVNNDCIVGWEPRSLVSLTDFVAAPTIPSKFLVQPLIFIPESSEELSRNP